MTVLRRITRHLLRAKARRTKSASVSTGDDSDPAFWFTLLTAALACIAAMLALHRNRCHVAVSAADRENHDGRS